MKKWITTVSDLKKVLARLPDDAPVLCPASDHSYRNASVDATTALYSEDCWSEDYGEDTTPESEYGKRVKVLVIG